MSPGEVLAAARGERGLTIRNAATATRIRAQYLGALEAGDLNALPPAVYAAGYLRTYAIYLGLDPEPLLGGFHFTTENAERRLGLGPQPPARRLVVTSPAMVTVGIVVAAVVFGWYAWDQLQSDQRAAVVPAAAQLAVVSPPSTPLPSPSPALRPIVVGVRVTDVVWVNVAVDSKPQYADAGRMLTAGSVVSFSGLDLKVTSGKASETFITIDGRDLGPLGAGVATKDFTSQTAT